MRLLYTLIILLLTQGAVAQTVDTIFRKDFNNGQIDFNKFGSNVSFSASGEGKSILYDTLVSLNNTPALITDLGNSKVYGVLNNYYYPTRDLFAFELATTGNYDSVLVQFDIKTNEITLLPSGDIELGSSVEATLSMNYESSSDNTLFMKSFRVRYLQHGILVAPTSARSEIYFTSGDRSNASILYVFAAPKNTAYFRGVYAHFNQDTPLEINDGKQKFVTPEYKLKDTVLCRFCQTTNDSADCMLNAKLKVESTPGFFDPNSRVLIDNIFIARKQEGIVTGIKTTAMEGLKKEIDRAFTIWGTKIGDLKNYTGLAIIHYKDGTTKKYIFRN